MQGWIKNTLGGSLTLQPTAAGSGAKSVRVRPTCALCILGEMVPKQLPLSSVLESNSAPNA